MTARRIATMKPSYIHHKHFISAMDGIHPTAAMLSAVKEADRICSGETSAVAYDSFDDLLADIDAEIAKEDSRE